MQREAYKPCKRCGSEIVGRRKNAIYCSKECAQAYNPERDRPSQRARRLASLRCNWCEKPLETTYQGTKFCNATCRERARYANGTEEAKARNKRAMLKKHYGITPEEYGEMFRAQRGVCAICSEVCATGRNLAVDHCHATGEIRGLLCANCNRALGLLRDDPERLRRAIAYLA